MVCSWSEYKIRLDSGIWKEMTLDDLVEQTWRKESNRVNCSLTGQHR